MEKKLTISKILIIFSAIIAIVAFFLPYIAQTGDTREYYRSRSSEKMFDNVDMTLSDMVDISILEYSKVYFLAGEEALHSKDAGIFYGCLFGSLAALSLLMILSAFGKKPILTLFWDTLMAGAFWAINWDIVDRGIMPSRDAIWGTAYYVYYPVAVIIAVSAIWMFIIKRHIKKLKATEKNFVSTLDA